MKKYSILFGVTAAFLLLLFTGCEKENAEAVPVQSVAELTGYGSVGLAERFAGIVTNRGEEEIKADSQKTVKDILVEEGDEVSAGDVLFTYDMELASLNLEKAELELQQLVSTKEAKEKEKAELEKEKAKAKQEDQLSYTLEIQSAETAIREADYNIALKEKEVARLSESLEITEVTAPLSGRIGKINESGTDSSSGEDTAFMTIVEAGAYRVKGYINENNMSALSEGTPVLIRSRMDGSTWTGTVSLIDWESPVSSSSGSDYGIIYEETSSEGELTTSSKYPFYIELDAAAGLLLGQHVYIEPAYGTASEGAEGLSLPLWYFIEYNENAGTVWADNGKGTLEIRTVTLASVNEEAWTATVTDGLSLTDLIAMPDETLTEGLPCEEMQGYDMTRDEAYAGEEVFE